MLFGVPGCHAAAVIQTCLVNLRWLDMHLHSGDGDDDDDDGSLADFGRPNRQTDVRETDGQMKGIETDRQTSI